MTSETEVYLTEAESPTHLAAEEAQAAVLTFLAMAGRLDLQAAHWLRLLQSAEITETEPEIRGHFEEHAQTLRALIREAREAEGELRQAMQALRQFGLVVARLREVVAAAAASAEEPAP